MDWRQRIIFEEDFFIFTLVKLIMVSFRRDLRIDRQTSFCNDLANYNTSSSSQIKGLSPHQNLQQFCTYGFTGKTMETLEL